MLRGLRDLLWPRVCPVCERECEEEEEVHRDCLARIARSLSRGTGSVPVFSCWEDGPEWFRVLHQWKYGGQSRLAGIVAREMALRPLPGLGGSVLVPMPDDPATQALLAAVRRRYRPHTVIALKRPGDENPLPLLEGRGLVDGKPAAYVCENFACQLPVTEVDGLARLLSQSLHESYLSR